jgi:hypothetical protein
LTVRNVVPLGERVDSKHYAGATPKGGPANNKTGSALWDENLPGAPAGPRPGAVASPRAPSFPVVRLAAPLFAVMALAVLAWGIGLFALAAEGDGAPRDVLVLDAPLDRSLAQVLAPGIIGADMVADPARTARALVDRNGRILGWLARDAAPSAARPGSPLALVLGFVGVGLCGFAMLSVRQLRRARNEFADTMRRADAAAGADAITGLPNRPSTLDHLDAALAGRAAASVVMLALIDLDNFRT